MNAFVVEENKQQGNKAIRNEEARRVLHAFGCPSTALQG
jgi:hypothetical protein